VFSGKISFFAAQSERAQTAKRQLEDLYGSVDQKEADVIVALGGDGLMLQALHHFMNSNKPIYGMRMGTVGFLMNDFSIHDLLDRLSMAGTNLIQPLMMEALDSQGTKQYRRAFNEVSLWRQTCQAARIRVFVDEVMRLEELICDGILVSTPAGSTGYNLSARGPVIPLCVPLLAISPISPFRPRHWRGALLRDKSSIRIEVLDHEKRSVGSSADHHEVRNCIEVNIWQDTKSSSSLMFDQNYSWEERILAEQFKC